MVARIVQALQQPTASEQRRLGIHLKLIRLQQGITAKSLAERIGVSPSLISKIESGAANPSMDVLRRIIMELNVKMADLMDGASPLDSRTPSQEVSSRRAAAVVRADERKLLRLPKRGLEYQLLTPDAQGAAEFVWVEIGPGEGGSEMQPHERGEESVLVLEGALDVYVGDQTYHLNMGDCLTCDATTPHMYRNETDGHCVWIYLAVPPTL